MEKAQLKIYNSLSRKKESFQPVNPPFVGLYVCGPTVYNEVHLGNVRTFINFDVIYRYLKYSGYKVRYVRNITDVGHLENDADEGEDKIAKRAKLENIEPMEVVQKYTNNFHEVMTLFNNIPPSIEPTATGHIIEQIELVQKLLEKGLAYEANGSVYFDVKKYSEKENYGILSGRKVEDLQAGSRELDAQDEKRNPEDFALWKKAKPQHIMRWNSPWGKGFPGWHLECTVMSTKYLGVPFDIHGGGMDLKFPHHECEIAQCSGGYDKSPAQYWIHSNMLTVNGTKMSKSLGNSFLPHELISGNHPLLKRGYSPMVIRFFMLQSHYSSTLDFSNEALDAAEKGYKRLMTAWNTLNSFQLNDFGEKGELDEACSEYTDQVFEHLNDDFNTAKALAPMFELSSKIYAVKNAQLPVSSFSAAMIANLKQVFDDVLGNILGLENEAETGENKAITAGLMELLLEIRSEVRNNKDFATSDKIRDRIQELEIKIKDGKDGTSWELP